MRRLRSSRGFTLVEVVVAIVMLTFGVLASAG
jgi:prepilin-type N-terminal cleavage/methylation domain-containing protein